MPLPDKPFVYCSDEDMDDLLSSLGISLRFEDDLTGTSPTPPELLLALKLKARSYASARIDLYCQPLYRAQELATSWVVNEWTTVIAVYWASCRRGNEPPKSLRQMLFGTGVCDDCGVMGEMRDVRSVIARIPDIGLRNPTGPKWSNLHFDDRYGVRKLRVIRQTSEPYPAEHEQPVDYRSEYPET